jgi:hypothetical protein
MKPALMILIFLRIFVNDKGIVGQAINNSIENGEWQSHQKNINSAVQNFMKPALMILVFLRIFVNDRQMSKAFPSVIFEESSADLDHAGDIDYIGRVGTKAFGIQIKPITANSNLETINKKNFFLASQQSKLFIRNIELFIKLSVIQVLSCGYEY